MKLDLQSKSHHFDATWMMFSSSAFPITIDRDKNRLRGHMQFARILLGTVPPLLQRCGEFFRRICGVWVDRLAFMIIASSRLASSISKGAFLLMHLPMTCSNQGHLRWAMRLRVVWCGHFELQSKSRGIGSLRLRFNLGAGKSDDWANKDSFVSCSTVMLEGKYWLKQRGYNGLDRHWLWIYQLWCHACFWIPLRMSLKF